MYKTELFKAVVQFVQQTCEVEGDIFRGNTREYADARHIAVYVLFRCGFSHRDVTRLTGLTRQAYYKITRDFDLRLETGGVIMKKNYKDVLRLVKKEEDRISSM